MHNYNCICPIYLSESNSNKISFWASPFKSCSGPGDVLCVNSAVPDIDKTNSSFQGWCLQETRSQKLHALLHCLDLVFRNLAEVRGGQPMTWEEGVDVRWVSREFHYLYLNLLLRSFGITFQSSPFFYWSGGVFLDIILSVAALGMTGSVPSTFRKQFIFHIPDLADSRHN